MGEKADSRLERNIAAWSDLEARADIIYADLLPERKIAFFEMVLVSVKLQANLNHLYSSGQSIMVSALRSSREQSLNPMYMPRSHGRQPTCMPTWL